MRKLWKSLFVGESSRYFFRSFLLNLFIAVVFGLLVVYLSASNRVNNLLESERLTLDQTVSLVLREVSDLQGDLLRLANSHQVRAFAEDMSEKHRRELTDAFVNLVQYSSEYQQARFISPQGQEIVRVNRVDGQPVVVTGDSLQNKSDRYYFQDSIGLPPGQVYVSPLDLNVEFGMIERPFNPMIRLATPLRDSTNTLKGLLILNYSADHLMTMLATILASSHGEPMLLNDEGDWLYSRDQSLLWGFMLGLDHKFGDQHPDVWAYMGSREQGQVETDDGMFVFRVAHPLEVYGVGSPGEHHDNARWMLVSQIYPDQILVDGMGAMVLSWPGLLVVLIGVAACALISAFRLGQQISLAAYRKSEAYSRGLLDGAPDGILLLDKASNCLEANEKACQLFGQSRRDLIGRNLESVVRQLSAGVLPDRRLSLAGQHGQVTEAVIEHANGRAIPVEVSSRYLEDGRWQGFLRDISDRKESERGRLRAEAVFLNTAEGIIITDNQGQIVDVNPAFLEISGYRRDELIGQNPRVQQSGRHSQAFYRELWQSLNGQGSWTGEIWNRRKNGEVYAAWENIAAVRDEQGQVENYISIISDISSLKDAESRLVKLANEDAVTGLLNRRAFDVALKHSVDRAKRHNYLLALIYLDLDRFKLVNDTLGHEVGDGLLKQVGATITECVRAEDVVGRLGGDEFTVLVENISSPEDAAIIAQNLIHALEQPLVVEGQEVVIPASVGIALYPRDGKASSSLARAADAAMYRAKAQGRNTYAFYASDMTDQAVMRFETEAALRQALANQEFELYYQPQWVLESGEVIGVEALIRWRHPDRGLLSPAAFISVAEESRLIEDIGRWVIIEACRQYQQWREQGLAPLKVAVNLSGRQLIYGDVPAIFRECLGNAEQDIPPGAVEFEVTETILQSGSRAVAALTELREMGAVVAIDDFGKGYSSLGHLSQLPVDALKIDQGFIDGLPVHGTNSAIVRAVVSMAQSMGLKVVAEGIENERQLRFLQELGCDFGQGYLFSKPVPAADIKNLVLSSRTAMPLR